MAEHTVKVPDVGEGIAEVELVSWAVEKGQAVTRNQVVAEVMTDKATVEVPAPIDGVVTGLTGTIGEILLVGSELFVLQVDGDEPRDDGPAGDTTAAPSPSPSPPATPATTPAPTPTPASPVLSTTVDRAPAGPAPPPVGRPDPGPRTAVAPRAEAQRPTATPAVRRRAREAGLDLRRVPGTGPAGRITHDDLDAIFQSGLSNGAAGAPPGSTMGRRKARTGVTDQPIVGLRRKIAERMVASTSTIPHITYVEEIDVTELERLRSTLNQRRVGDRPKLTLLPFLVRAIVNEIARFPIMNAHVLDPDPAAGSNQAQLRLFDGVHIGIATQTDNGLVVPVLRHAEAESMWSSAVEIAELAKATREGRIASTELSGSTITITSLGALGGIVSTPVINKPEVAIVGVNKIVTRPVWIDGQFVPRQIMNLSSSFDHRVVDGWDAANFVQGLRAALEQPALLFVEPEV